MYYYSNDLVCIHILCYKNMQNLYLKMATLHIVLGKTPNTFVCSGAGFGEVLDQAKLRVY